MNKRVTTGWLLILVLAVAAGVVGCSSSSDGVPPSRMEVAPSFKENTPGIIKRYSAFYIEPIETYAVEDDYLRRVEDADVRRLANNFRAKLIRRLGDRQVTVPLPAQGVAFIKITISDVSSNYAALQLLPGLLVPNAMRGGASIEVRFLDSVSQRQIAVFRDSRQGARKGYLSGLGKWDGVEKAFDEWAEMLASNLRQ